MITAEPAAGKADGDPQRMAFHNQLARECSVTDIGGGDFEPGSSRRQAIVVSNVLDEYAWIQERYPDHRVTFQALCWFPDGFFDMLRIESDDGDVRELYFALGRRSRKGG